jgi:hypothetical protein
MFEPSLRHVGQHGTTRSVIQVVSGLPLRHKHDANGPRVVPAGPDLQEYLGAHQTAIALGLFSYVNLVPLRKKR